MAQEVEFGNGGSGKIRSFWVGLLLAIVTIGIYYWFWYYFVNDELKDIGQSRGDQNLGSSSPAWSVAAVTVGGLVIVPPFISVYNYGRRVQRAQRLVGVPHSDQINPILAFLTYLFGFLLIPLLYHYWYVTKHQNRALAAAGRPIGGVDPLGYSGVPAISDPGPGVSPVADSASGEPVTSIPASWDSPSGDSPDAESLSGQPPGGELVSEQPPGADPPSSDPPSSDPPISDLPGGEPPTSDPPANGPPTSDPPDRGAAED